MALATTTHIAVNGGSFSGNVGFTTASFTPSSNSLLVAVVHFSSSSSTANPSTISGGGLTWTRQTGLGDTECRGDIFTAPVGTAASMTVTVSPPATVNIGTWQVNVSSWTGYDTTTPVGLKVATAIANDGAVNLSLGGTTASTSAVIGSRHQSGDIGQTTAATPGTGWTETQDTSQSGWGGMQVQYNLTGSLTQVSWADVNVNTTSDFGTVGIGMEIKAAAGGSTVSGDGSSAGVGAATGVGAPLNRQSGSSNGSATATAVGASTSLQVGSSSGVGTATGISGSAVTGDGASAGTSTATGVGGSLIPGDGSSAGTSTATATGNPLSTGTGNAAGTATATATATVLAMGTGFSSGTSNVTAVALGVAAPTDGWKPRPRRRA